MSNIDKRALREAADGVLQKYGSEWFETGSQLCTVHKSKIELIAAANPATVLALLDELEAAEKRIAELEAQEAEPVAYIGKIMLEDLTDGARSCGRVWADATDRMSGEDRIPLFTAAAAEGE
ncbi:ead/Ea22-like family protein [Enterobacter hormaechei]|nr:ead/Ea22-like family protein [Enterobacter hormaechei]KAF6712390.1 ead/Ea22-like family protein [Enterobacter hormaechei]